MFYKTKLLTVLLNPIVFYTENICPCHLNIVKNWKSKFFLVIIKKILRNKDL